MYIPAKWGLLLALLLFFATASWGVTIDEVIHSGNTKALEAFLNSFPAAIEQRSTILASATPLFLAIYKRKPAMVRLLLERGASLDARFCGGRTPLHEAGALLPEVVPLLLEYGADPNAENDYGEKPLVDGIFRLLVFAPSFVQTLGPRTLITQEDWRRLRHFEATAKRLGQIPSLLKVLQCHLALLETICPSSSSPLEPITYH